MPTKAWTGALHGVDAISIEVEVDFYLVTGYLHRRPTR